MKPSDLADKLGVNSDTIRRWGATYAEYLSPSANPVKGKTRAYSDEDVRKIILIANLRDAGVEHGEIEDRLKEHAVDHWVSLPPIPSAWEMDDIPAPIVADKISDLAKLAVMRDELTKAEKALITAESRIEELGTELTVANEQIDQLTTERNQLQIAVEQLRGQVQALEARIEGFNIAYGFGRDKPLPIAVVIMITAIVAAILIVLAVVIGSVI